MGRKSLLTEKEWGEIGKSILSGRSSNRELAREYKISEAAIRRRFPARRKDVKEMVDQMLDIDEKLMSLPKSTQCDVILLYDELKSISNNLASAGRYGAMTAQRLAILAHAEASRINPNASINEHVETIKSIVATTRGSNDAAFIGLSLLNANKAEMEKSAASDNITAIEMRVVDHRMVNGKIDD